MGSSELLCEACGSELGGESPPPNSTPSPLCDDCRGELQIGDTAARVSGVESRPKRGPPLGPILEDEAPN